MTTATTYSDLHVRLDTNIKNRAEAILDDLGISPSGAVNIFYRKVIEQDGLPFSMRKNRVNGMLDFDSLSPEEIAAHLNNAAKEIEEGEYSSLDDAFAEILGEDYERIRN